MNHFRVAGILFLVVLLLIVVAYGQAAGATVASNDGRPLEAANGPDGFTPSLSLTSAVTTAIEGEISSQDEDELSYLPIILKGFDPTQPWHILSVTKTITPGIATPGEPLTYTLRYGVSGNEPAPGLTLVDTVPPSTTYQGCTGGSGCTEAAGQVTWNLGDTLPSTTGLVAMVVQVDNHVVSGSTIYNTALLTDTAGLTATGQISTPVKTPGAWDVAIIFDMSGSMQFDTACYGCYEPFGDGTTDWKDLNYGHDYPIPDFIHPIPVAHLPHKNIDGSNVSLNYGLAAGNPTLSAPNPQNKGELCWQRDGNTPDYKVIGGGDPKRYVIIEAELYSQKSSFYEPPARQPGQGYWAVQHVNYRTIDRMRHDGSTSITYQTGATPALPSYPRNSWVSHHPYVLWTLYPDPPDYPGIPFGHAYTLDEVRTDPNSVPSLEYDFITAFDWDTSGGSGDDTRIWARVQGGGMWSIGNRYVYWATYVYNDLYGSAGGDPTLATPLGSGQIETIGSSAPAGASYGGAQAPDWVWRELTTFGTKLNLENGQRYTLKIWAGDGGFDIDQIVIGNRNSVSFTTDYSNAAPAQYDATSYATPGSAFRQACNRCNPIYGLLVDQADCQSPLDNGWSTVSSDGTDLAHPQINPIFSGYQSLRRTKEAVKQFIKRFNPELDQVGVVGYSSTTWDAARVELRCLRHDGSGCFQGTSPISYTEILNVLEIVPPNGATDIAGGMLKGLEMLGINADNIPDFDNSCQDEADHCGRGEAARQVMILIVDGIPNKDPGGVCDDAAYAHLWPPTQHTADNEAQAYDCVVYYAQIAAQNSVDLYTIGLGNGVDTELLEYIATLPGSGGQYFAAPTPASLEAIFEAIR